MIDICICIVNRFFFICNLLKVSCIFENFIFLFKYVENFYNELVENKLLKFYNKDE